MWSRFEQCLGTFTFLLVEVTSETDFLDIYRSTFSEPIISETQKLWGSSFFSKYSKFKLDFKNWARNWEKVYFRRKLLRNWYRYIASIRNRALFIASQYVNKQTQNLACQQERIFRTQLTWQWPVNMIEVMWCIFQQCLGTFTMLLLEGSSETGLFRHLSDYVFGVRNFENTKCTRVIFFF